MTSMDKHWIQTFSGRQFFPLDPQIEQLDIEDIARALSMTCRYVGHVTKFYSVAEHCVRVSREVERRLFEQDCPEEHMFECARWGLVHDAAEAYVGDVSRPLKHAPGMEGYIEIEARVQRAITDWLGLGPTEPAIVKLVDSEILGTEVRKLKLPVHREWAPYLAPDFPRSESIGWKQELAENIFLRRYRRLFEET